MKILVALILTFLPASLSLWGFQTGNDFLFYLCGLVAFAPLTAISAMKVKLF